MTLINNSGNKPAETPATDKAPWAQPTVTLLTQHTVESALAASSDGTKGAS